MPYDLEPRYPLVGGAVEYGHPTLAQRVRDGARVLAIDGPAAAPWERIITSLAAELRRDGSNVDLIDVRDRVAPWPEIHKRTDTSALSDDPVFAKIHDGPLSSLFDETPLLPATAGLSIVFGPGSALFPHDVLWYADLPKALGLDAIEAGRARNLGQPTGATGEARRLLFIDWPMEDRHRRELTGRWALYIDTSDPAEPRFLTASALEASLEHLALGPFRTRPRFLAEPWGGRWMTATLGASPGERLGLGYELIAPEAGVLLGEERPIEVALDLVVASEQAALLGTGGTPPVFPIRFDYLDTVAGGNLSVHCHPQSAYMREVFGHALTQHETYYVMVEGDRGRIFLGLRDDVDVDAFRTAAVRSQTDGTPLDIDRFVQSVPARRHQLYLVPAGTPHGSGVGNVVLEISATPYLYSLRFYDWLRADLDGGLRPVQLDHAFANLAAERRGGLVPRELVPEATVVRKGNDYSELAFRRHPALPFAVQRVDFEGIVPNDTGGRVNVLNLVEGDDIEVRTAAGRRHRLSYAETIVIPAAVGRYELVPLGGGSRKVIKAFEA